MKFATQEQMLRGNYATYNTVKDVIVQEVQRKYKFGSDVAKSIRDGQRSVSYTHLTLPTIYSV